MAALIQLIRASLQPAKLEDRMNDPITQPARPAALGLGQHCRPAVGNGNVQPKLLLLPCPSHGYGRLSEGTVKVKGASSKKLLRFPSIYQ